MKPTTTDTPLLRAKRALDGDSNDEEHDALHALVQEHEILSEHKARLDEELPKMRKQNQRLMAFFQDAAAFIRSDLWRKDIVLATLAHDINGLANDEPCFLPRVTGYAKREQEGKS